MCIARAMMLRVPSRITQEYDFSPPAGSLSTLHHQQVAWEFFDTSGCVAATGWLHAGTHQNNPEAHLRSFCLPKSFHTIPVTCKLIPGPCSLLLYLGLGILEP